MTKLLIGILASLIILLFLPEIALAHNQTQLIEMTPEGFFPDPVTVDVNSTIIFVNKDSVDRWPASNVHPTHELYPEFDPKESIKSGKSWTFKPKRVGEFRYHDHNLPHKRGVITVLAEEGGDTRVAPDEVPSENSEVKKEGFKERFVSFFSQLWTKIMTFFLKTANSNYQPKSVEEFRKLSAEDQTRYLEEMASSLDGQKAWQFIKEAYIGESGTSGNIHDLTHLSGRLIYQKEGFSGLGNCSSEFAFGCYHGFLDTAFSKDLTHLNEAETACLKLGPVNTGPVASCTHGIGHGIASFHSTKDLKGALGSCRKLETGKEFCFDGVFMEFVRSAPIDFFKASDPLYPCNALEKEYAVTYSFACGRNQPSLLMSRFNKGFDEIISICNGSDSKPIKNGCFDALGFSLASQSVDDIIGGCQKIGDGEYILRCIKSAVGEMVFQNIVDWRQSSRVVCDSLTKPTEKEGCYNYIQQLVKEYQR